MTPVEGDFIARNFRFESGETLPELRLHYRPLGAPRKDASGQVRNAVLVMHGTGGTGAQFVSRQFAGLKQAQYGLLMMSSIPLQWQKEAPTREAADLSFDNRVRAALCSASIMFDRHH